MVVLTFQSVDVLNSSYSALPIQMKAVEQFCHVVLFIMLYKVVLNFLSVDEIIACNYSNESCSAIFSCLALCESLQRYMYN